MKNPYEVLGLPDSADIEQVKQAYRELAREYSLGGSENSSADKKMQELNEAYDAIIMNSRGGSQRYTPPGNANQNYRYAPPRSEFDDIRAKIQSGRIDDAQTLLDGIPPYNRNAEWYYLKGLAQNNLGWLEEALKNFQTACNMDPNNPEYRAALNNLNQSRTGGFRTRRTENGGCGTCDICSGLICADCCCECFGGDLIPCC